MPRTAQRHTNKKRANGEGTITRRKDGRWQAALYKPDGDRKFYYGATRGDVHEKLVKAQNALMDGLPLPDEKVTLSKYLDYWLESLRKLGSIRRNTWDSYEGYVRVHIKPRLGKTPLAKLRPTHVPQFMTDKLNVGVSPFCPLLPCRPASGPRPSDQTRARRPQCRGVDKPTENLDLPCGEPLRADEARRLVDGLARDRLKALHILMLYLGLRQGEALGLEWSDLDLDAGICHIRTALVRHDGQYQLEDLKTEKSRRDLPLNAHLVKLLRDHHTAQNKEQLKAAKWHNEWALVFTTPDGRPLHQSVVTHQFQDALERLGMEKRRHYDLRHTMASLLIDQGAELRDVMEQLGHSQISLTANTYGHIFLDRKKKLAAAMGDLLGPRSKGKAG